MLKKGRNMALAVDAKHADALTYKRIKSERRMLLKNTSKSIKNDLRLAISYMNRHTKNNALSLAENIRKRTGKKIMPVAGHIIKITQSKEEQDIKIDAPVKRGMVALIPLLIFVNSTLIRRGNAIIVK